VATTVHLTADLEKFAHGCVESGRYNNVSEVVRSALRLLQDAEAQRQAFASMLKTVRSETKRKGTRTIDELTAEMDAIISSKP
jgi:antitoxin ParD1/3/4